MAIDLTPDADGTYRNFGNKLYIYNSASTRWERANTSSLTANVSIDYDGKASGSQVISGQSVAVTVKWNIPVNTSQFSTANLSLTGASTSVTSFAQDSVDPKLYKFNFSFAGAVGQISIPAGQVSVNNLSNLPIYSEAIAGAYLPYALLSVVSKSNTSNPVFTFSDPNFLNATRQIANNMIGTASLAASNRRIQISLTNMGAAGVANSGTTGLTSTDIKRSIPLYYGFTPTIATTIYANNTTTTVSANQTSTLRYAEMYLPSSAFTSNNYFSQLSIPAAAYTDSGLNNIGVTSVYYNIINNNTNKFNTTAVYTRTPGTANGVIKVYIDMFGSLANSANSKLITTSGGGTLSNLTLVTSTTTDANAFFGNIFTANYTANVANIISGIDYTEIITINAGAITMPVANSSNINGISYTVDPPGSGLPWSGGKSSNVFIIPAFAVNLAPLTMVATNPGVGSTITSSISQLVLTPNHPATTSLLGTPTYSIWSDNYNGTNLVTSGSTTDSPLYSPSTPIAINLSATNLFKSNSTYYVSIPANAYYDDTGHLNSSYNYSFNTGYPGALTLTASSPSNGSTGYNGSDPIILNSNRTIYSSNTKANSVIYTGSLGGTVFATNTINASSNTNVYITVPSGMSPSTTYYVSIPANTYFDGLNVGSDAYNYSFTTATAPTANNVIFDPSGSISSSLGAVSIPQVAQYYTTTWQVPAFLTSINAVVIGSGSPALDNNSDATDFGGYAGGGGGGLSYVNNISVTPGETLTVKIPILSAQGPTYAAGLYRGATALVAVSATGLNDVSIGSSGGTVILGTGGTGGTGGSNDSRTTKGGAGGGAAGTYYGTGGSGGNAVVTGSATGTTGANSSIGGTGSAFNVRGTTGSGSSPFGPNGYNQAGTYKSYGAGGSGGAGNNVDVQTTGVNGTLGVVRIVWGAGRAFPNTNISTVSS